MSDYDNGFARAQAMYEAQEQPDHSQDICGNCGLVWEEHTESQDISKPDAMFCADGSEFSDTEYEPEYDTLEEKADAEGGD